MSAAEAVYAGPVAIVVIKFKAGNIRDKNFTSANMKRGLEQIETSPDRYFEQRGRASREEATIAETQAVRLEARSTCSRSRCSA